MPSDDIIDDYSGLTRSFSDYSGFGVYEYRTKDGEFEFKFELVQSGDEVKIYILEQPDYDIYDEDRDEGGHETHRYHDDDRMQYWICVDEDDRPTNVPDALSWLVYWSEGTGEYIRTGEEFS